jgi:hypothetical protein
MVFLQPQRSSLAGRCGLLLKVEWRAFGNMPQWGRLSEWLGRTRGEYCVGWQATNSEMLRILHNSIRLYSALIRRD